MFSHFGINRAERLPRLPIGLFKGSTFNNFALLPLDKEERLCYPPHLSSTDSLRVPIGKGTLTPSNYRDCYGLFVINSQGASILRQQEVDSDPEALDSFDFCQAASPVLVEEGKLTFTDENFREERFQWHEIDSRYGKNVGACPPGSLYHADQPNPRSAVGVNKTGDKVYFVTVKGREENTGYGLDLAQLAALMQKIGIYNALNLDGGYSAFQLTKSEDMWKTYSSSAYEMTSNESVPFYITAQPKDLSSS